MSRRARTTASRWLASSVARDEPFDISAVLAPCDHIVACRRSQFRRQRRDRCQVARFTQVDKSGAEIWLAGQDTRRFAGEPPVTNEAFKRADRRIARLIIVNRKAVTGHQPQPRRLPFQRRRRRAPVSRDRSQISSWARRSAPSKSVASNDGCPRKTITPAGGSFGSAAVFAMASTTADSSDNSTLITRRVGELNRAANSAASAVVSVSESANSSQLPWVRDRRRAGLRHRTLHPVGVEDLLLQRQGHRPRDPPAAARCR